MAERGMFAGTEATRYTGRRTSALTIALVLHAIAAAPLLVSTVRVDSSSRPLESLGLTFVMVPERGIGSPPPAPEPEPEPEPPAPSPAPETRPAPREPVAPVAVTTPAPLTSSLVLDVLPRMVPSGTDRPEDAAHASQRAPSLSVPNTGNQGIGESAPSPAVGTAAATSNWAGLVLGQLEQFRRYPAAARRARQEGVSQVRFTIDREGQVLACVLARSSGHDLLDDEAVALVRRAAPLPPPPPEIDGDTVTLTVPVEFFLTR